MAWDFTVDSDIQLDMAKYLKEKADELDTQFANLYTQIGPSNLGIHWVGSDYDAFNVGCEGYRQALGDMTDSVRMYASHFEKVAEGTDLLSSLCISTIQHMTTRGDALPGSGGATTSGGTGTTGTGGNGNNPTGGTATGQGNTNSTTGQGTVTGVWKSYQDAADAGYSNIQTEHEFARGGYNKEKYGTYDNYLIAMQERYVGSTYKQDVSAGRGKGNTGGTTTTTAQGGTGGNSNNTHGGRGGSLNNAQGGTGGSSNNTHGGRGGSLNNAQGGSGGSSNNTHGGGTLTPGQGGNGTQQENPGYWDQLGQRYVDDYNDFAGDVSDTWSNADGLISGAYALAETGVETSLFLADTVVNTAQAGSDMIQSGANWLFDAGDSRSVGNGDYWDNIGKDYAENFDFSSCDNFAEGLGVAVCALPRTIVDAGQTVVNIGADAVEVVGDAASWVKDKVGDGISSIGNFIFG